MQTAFDHCEQLVRETDKDRFLATLFAPQKYRRALHAVYAFHIEISRVGELAREAMPGELRLQWWREAIEGAAGEAMGSPVAAAVREVIVRYGLSPASFIDAIDAHTFDLYDEPMASMGQLQSYASRTSTAIFRAAARILADDEDDIAISLAEDAGQAATIADILGKFPRHAARRQLYVPLETLQQHGARAEDAFARRPTTELRAALAEMRLRARRHLARIAESSSQIPSTVLPAFLPLAPVRLLLQRMERRSYDPFRPPLLSQWRRQWCIWRTAKAPGRIGS